MNRVLDSLDRFSTARRVAVLFFLEVAILACENGLNFPLSVPYMRRATGHVYLDMCAFCSAPQIYAELDGFGEVGRRLQLLLMPTIDVVIPVTSGLLGATALTLFTGRWVGPGSRYRWIAMVPVVATALDFLENAGITGLVLRYPERALALAAATGFTTGIKFAAYGLTVLLTLFLSGGVAAQHIRNVSRFR